MYSSSYTLNNKKEDDGFLLFTLRVLRNGLRLCGDHSAAPTTVRSNNITDTSAHVTNAPLSSTPPSLWRHPKFQPKERLECEHVCMQRDLRLLQMNARINFNLPVMIPSYFPSEWRFICPDLSERGVLEGADKLKSHPSASSCTLSGRKMQKQYSPQHSLIQLSFISAALD